MLKVFAFDYGGTGHAGAPRAPAARRQDDALMLRALCADLRLLPGVELLTLDDNVSGEAPGTLQRRVAARIAAADAVWPLASVSGGTLERLSREVLRHGRILLGSAPDTVQVAASKSRTCAVLSRAALPVAATFGTEDILPAGAGAWVVKPDEGGAHIGTRLFPDSAAAQAWAATQACTALVLQPFIAGRVGSLSLLCRDGTARLLACNEQRVAVQDNRFRCLGATVNGLADLAGLLEPLGRAVAAALPGLWGYAAVDFILAPDGPVVLDVSPRLTISYAGLRTSTGANPAEAVLALLQGGLPGTPAPRVPPARVDVAAFGPR